MTFIHKEMQRFARFAAFECAQRGPPQSARKNVRFAHLAQLALVEFFNWKLTNYYERLPASTSI